MTTIVTGCCDSCAPAGANTALNIACTLEAGDFKDRAAGIRALATRSLRTSRRKPLQLSLTYGPEALDQIEALVAMEAECCSFLDFDLQSDVDGVHLTITAPIEALVVADGLFAHCSAELAGESA